MYAHLLKVCLAVYEIFLLSDRHKGNDHCRFEVSTMDILLLAYVGWLLYSETCLKPQLII